MDRVLSFLPVPDRPGKPRDTGITIARDDGLGFETAKALVESVGPFIDYMKLRHFFVLTASRDSNDLTSRKVRLYRQHAIDVLPGGIVFEIAMIKGLVDRYFDAIAAFGCSAVECSENMITIAPPTRREVLRQAGRTGLKVLWEVGDKYPGAAPDLEELVAEIRQLLEWGATKVVVERSYTDLLLGPDGHLPTARYIVDLVEAVGLRHLTFEAETPAHQRWFLHTFGPDVNIGPNIPPEMVMKLEPTRRTLSREGGYTWVTALAELEGGERRGWTTVAMGGAQ
ncbi:MAG TPA: phosphosulfolactate synthase [bacterium]|nr:phosphosulfolactate synthase [bacterium]